VKNVQSAGRLAKIHVKDILKLSLFMLNFNLKKILFYSFIVILIFTLDRASKLYILNYAEVNNSVDIFINSYLNLYLIWNKGIGFGLLSLEESTVYNFITFFIFIIIFIIFYMIYKANNYQVYFLLIILGGAIGNLFDRVYYSAVPDFIDLHINDFHWFIFNVADIFISIGIFCLIMVEIFFKKENINDKK